MDEIAQQAVSLGIAGLLFVMWWHERNERLRQSSHTVNALDSAGRLSDVNERLLQVVQANTEAMTGLREELRFMREAQQRWIEQHAPAKRRAS